MITRSLYFFALLTVIAIAGVSWNRSADPAFRYRRLDDDNALCPAIALYVDNGDTLSHVRSTLGPGLVGSHIKAQSWIDLQVQNRDSDGFDDQYPNGILPTDQFVAYSGFPTQFVIQFRDNRVVNLPKQWLVDTYSDDGG